MADFDEIADELYAVPQEDFTARRNAVAKQAKAEGDAELSEQVKSLAKPTAAAALANLLARERADDLEELALLGERMREATAALDGALLRELTPQRHRQVDGLVKDATTLAGRKVSTDVAQKLRETLDAALVDPAAAQAVRSGRLTSALRHVGFGVVDESGEPSNVVALAPRRREEAERAAAEAEAALDAAEARVDDLRTALDGIAERIETAQGEVERLTAELEQSRAELAEAKKDRQRVEGDLKDAEREARMADRRSQAAAAKLDS